MKKIYVLLMLAFLFLGVEAQVTITNPTNTTPNLAASYPSLAAALTDLNAVTAMSGPVTLTLTGSETAPSSTGFTLGSASLNAVLSSTNTVTLNQTGGSVLNAAVGVAASPSATPDCIFKLNGADWITIDGLTFTDGNAATATVAMEVGLGMFKLSTTDGCQNNTVKNCIFNMQRISNGAGAGGLFDGANAIEISNSTISAAITSLTPASAAGSNSNNKIYTNTINGGNIGIGLNGFAASAGVGPAPNSATFLGDLNNDIGGTGAGTGNTIQNFGGGAATNPAAGIRANNQWSANISYNSINNNTGAGVNHATTLRGIYGQAGTSANVTISNNTISLKSAGTTSALTGIDNIIGATAASNTVTLTNNIVQNCTYTTATTATMTGILAGASATTQTMTNNQVINNAIGLSGTASSCTFQGIYSSVTNTTTNMTSNTVTGNQVLNSFGVMYGLRNSTAILNITGNTVANQSIPNSAGATSSTNYGIYDGSAPTTETYTNNNINNLSITGSSTATAHLVTGIYNLTTSTGTKTFSGNNINNLNFTSSSTGYASVYGIRNAYGTTCNVFKNKIYSLSSTGATPTVAGIFIGGTSGTTWNVYNNLVSDITTPNSTGHNLYGILCGTVGTNHNIYFNTVYLNGTSTGTGFASSAIFLSSTTPTVTLNNNIFVNLSTATGTGLTSALRRTSAALTGYGSTSNNNDFYAGPAGPANLLYYDGTNSDQTLAAFKARVTPRESASISENPPFLSTVGADPNFLHINTGVPTQLESGGIPITGITDDYDGNTRNVTTPDIGADEFAGILLDLVGPTITITPLTFTCATGNRTLTATITDPSGVPTSGIGLPVLYYKINAGAYTAVQGVSIGSNQYTFTFGSGVVLADVVSYYIVAQDMAGTPNVGSNPSTGATGFTANPPAAATPPTTPFSYTIAGTLSGTITVGTAGTYTTITAAVNAYNTNCISGTVVFELLDATYPTETFPIIINQNPSASATNTLTIKPTSGGTTVISGNLASNSLIRILGNYVTIDGSNNGTTTRNLTISNTSTTSPSVLLVGSAGTTPVTNVTVKNTIIINGVNTSSAVVISDATTSGTAGYFTNITFQNNSVQKAYVGLYAIAVVSAGNGNGLLITGNNLNATGANAIRYTGIYVQGANGATVEKNNIGNFTGTDSEDDRGIWFATGTQNSIIDKNVITNLNYTGTGGYGGHGMDITTGLTNANIRISNNMIANITGDGWTYIGVPLDNPIGIALSGTQTGVNIYYNTINLYGNTLNQTLAMSMGVFLGTGSTATLQDNIIVNNLGLLGAIGYGSSAVHAQTDNTQFAVTNYNDYSVAPTGSGGKYIGQIASTGQTTLAGWQTATAQEANSLNVNPVFVSPTDLHLVAADPANASLADAGAAVAGITTDIDGQTRSTTPDLGADEFLNFGVVAVGVEYFRGSKAGTANFLDWKVDCSSDPSVRLILERSADGRTFKSIQDQNVTAARCAQGFSYTDAAPLAGINYYRLKTISPDGAFRYSVIVALINKDKGFELISVAPNPVKANTVLSISTVKAGKMTIAVSDMTGKVIMTQNINVIAGNNPITMNFATLGAGTYNIKVINADNEVKSVRFVKY